jgi:hypothetical protein
MCCEVVIDESEKSRLQGIAIDGILRLFARGFAKVT